ncbi:hypothetical protein Droror1_Dr00013701 [Drosera rotundifolia]
MQSKMWMRKKHCLTDQTGEIPPATWALILAAGGLRSIPIFSSYIPCQEKPKQHASKKTKEVLNGSNKWEPKQHASKKTKEVLNGSNKWEPKQHASKKKKEVLNGSNL